MLILLAGGLAGVMHPRCAAAETITFDLKKSHVFQGFGVQVWSQPQDLSAVLALLDGLHIKHVRMGMVTHSDSATLTRDSSPSALLTVFKNNTRSIELSRTTAFAARLKELRVDVHLVVWETPPVWREERPWVSPDGQKNDARIGIAANIPQYANYICAQVLYGRALGFDIRFVELANEPDGTWGTKWTPEDYSRLVSVSREVLTRNGLSEVGIEGPGTGTERAAAPYLVALKALETAGLLSAISVHDWDTRIDGDPVGLTDNFRSTVANVNLNLPVHVTELNDEAPRWRIPGGLSPTGKKLYRTDTAPFAVALAGEVLQAVALGASQAFIWEAEDPFWEKSYLGLLNEKGNWKPSADALKVFFPLVSAGEQLAPGSSNISTIESAAFFDEHRIVIVLVNEGMASEQVLVRGATLPLALKALSSAECYIGQAVSTSDCSSASQLRHDGLHLYVPGGSVMAVLLSRNGT